MVICVVWFSMQLLFLKIVWNQADFCICPIFSQAKLSSILPGVSFTLLNGSPCCSHYIWSGVLRAGRCSTSAGFANCLTRSCAFLYLKLTPGAAREMCERHVQADVSLRIHEHGAGRRCYYGVKKQKESCIHCSPPLLWGASTATPMSALIGSSSFSWPDWTVSIVISICCWPPNWHLFTVNDPGSPSGQQTLAGLGVENWNRLTTGPLMFVEREHDIRLGAHLDLISSPVVVSSPPLPHFQSVAWLNEI